VLAPDQGAGLPVLKISLLQGKRNTCSNLGNATLATLLFLNGPGLALLFQAPQFLSCWP
jgi:hypothetical protein